MFWPQGHYLNKLGRGLLGDALYQISRLCGFRRISPYISLCKNVTLRGGAIFGPWGKQWCLWAKYLLPCYCQRRQL